MAVAELIKDPAFWSLPGGDSERIKILEAADSDFKNMQMSDKGKILETARPQTAGKTQDIEQPEVMDMQGLQAGGMGEVAQGGLSLLGMWRGGKEGAKIGYKHMPGGPRAKAAGGVVGAVVGAGIGGAGGEITGEVPRRAEEGRLPTTGELVNAGLRGAESGVVAETIGQGGMALLNKGMKWAGDRLLGKATPEQLKVAADAESKGILLRPAEITESDTAGILEQTAKRSLFGKGAFHRLDVKNEAAFKGAIEDWSDQVYGVAVKEQRAGELIQNAIKGKAIPEWRALQRKLYEAVDAQAGQASVETEAIFKNLNALKAQIDPKTAPQAAAIVDRVLGMVSERGYTSGLKVTPKHVPAVPEQIIKSPILDATTGKPSLSLVPGTPSKLKGFEAVTTTEGMPKPKTITFADASDMRSLLLQIGRDGSDVLPDRMRGIAESLAGQMDTAMSTTAKAVGANTYNAWRVANKATKDAHDLWDSDLITRALKTNAEDVVKTAFVRGGETETATVMKALKNDPVATKVYQRAAIEQLLTKGSTEGFLSGRSLYAAALGKNGIGIETIKKTFPDNYGELVKFLEVGRRMTLGNVAAGNASNTGRSMINFFELRETIGVGLTLGGAALSGFAAGPLAAAGIVSGLGGYVIGVKALARIMNDPNGLRYLREGMTVGPKTARAGEIATKLLTIATAHLVDHKPMKED